MASNLLSSPLPREYELGKCSYPSVNPRDYDADCKVAYASPTANGKTSPSARAADAIDKCEGCPIIQLCAEMAIKERSYGVIRAGISLGSTALRKWQKQSLQLIADGYEARAVIESLNPALQPIGASSPASRAVGTHAVGGGHE